MQPDPPLFDFGNPPTDRRPITIRARRPILLHRIGEASLRHTDAGEAVTVERHTLASVDPGDIEVLP